MDATTTLNTELAGRYQIERELGRGGMAAVYLARDLRHNRPVALKVLDPELGAILGVERFLSEIRVTANLQHPHLLPLFDSGVAGGLLYYVMPYIEGESLRARLDREKQLPVDDAVRMTLAVLSALDYAHGHGVVHRDLKPENILLQHGEPVVADFGIALAVSNAGGARITQTGLSLGTPQYMSPEQATGDRLIDARSDVYSMGAVTYEMLAGDAPHTGATVQAIIAKVITERPRSLRILRDTVPEEVDAAVLKALAKLPADRWPSARAFADALRGTTSAGALIRDGLLSSLARRVRRTTRSTTFWRGAAAAMAVVVAGLAWRGLRPAEPSGNLQLAKQLTFDGNVVGAAISPDGGWLAYVTDDCLGKDFTCTRTLQVREVDGTQSVRLLTWPEIGSDLHWSPDGATVGFVGTPDSLPPALYLIPRLGGSPQRVAVAATARTFAPNGQLVLTTGEPGRQALVWFDSRTLTRVDSVPLPAGLTIAGLEFTPDGERIIASALSLDPGRLVLLDGRGRLLDSSSTLQARRIARWDRTQAGIFVVTPAPGTGDNIMYIPIVRGRVRHDRARVALGMVQDGSEGIIDVARTGRFIVLAGPTRLDVQVLRFGEPGAQWRSVAQHTSWVWPNAISPDGALIAGSETDNIGENVYLFPVAGGAQTRLTSQNDLRDYPNWSPDGRHLAYDVASATTGAIKRTMMLDRAGGPEREIHPGHTLGSILGWAGNDAVLLILGRTLSVVDTTGAVRRTLVVPDSLAPTSKVITDAATSRAIWWSSAAGAIVAGSLTSGTFAIVFRTTAALQPVSSGSDGTLFAVTVGDAGRGGEDLGAQARPSHIGPGGRREQVLEKLPPGGTAFVRVALASSCWVSTYTWGLGVTIDPRGTSAACAVRRYTPDVWLANPGGSGP